MTLVRLDEEPPQFTAPSRPAVVELAAAVLIVGGILGLIGVAGNAAGLPAGTEPLVLLTAGLNAASIAVGLLVRTGRAWLVAVNYVAVLGFLDLTAAGGSGLAAMLGVADVLVVVILVLNKAWFDAKARERRLRRDAPPDRR